MYIDIILGAIILVLTLIGFKKGIVIEFLSLMGLIFNIIVSKKLTPVISDYFKVTSDNARSNQIITYSLIFFIIFVIIFIIIHFIKKIVKKSLDSITDRMIGALVGFIKGCLVSVVLLVIVVLASNFHKDVKTQLRNSYSYKIYGKVEDIVIKILPDDLMETIKKITNQESIKESIKKALDGRN